MVRGMSEIAPWLEVCRELMLFVLSRRECEHLLLMCAGTGAQSWRCGLWESRSTHSSLGKTPSLTSRRLCRASWSLRHVSPEVGCVCLGVESRWCVQGRDSPGGGSLSQSQLHCTLLHSPSSPGVQASTAVHVKNPKHWQPYRCLDAWKYCMHGLAWVALLVWLLDHS